jgi:hypothetical protein
VRALWDIFEGRGEGITAAHSRGALAILTMAAKGNPSIITSKLDSLLRHGLGPRARDDALMARYTCIALQRIALGGEQQKVEVGSPVFAALTWLVKSSPLPDESWYSAAEQAVNAIYALHPTPGGVCAGLVKEMAGGMFGRRQERGGRESGEKEKSEGGVTEQASEGGEKLAGEGTGAEREGRDVDPDTRRDMGAFAEGENREKLDGVQGGIENGVEDTNRGEREAPEKDAEGQAEKIAEESATSEVEEMQQPAADNRTGQETAQGSDVNAPSGAAPTAHSADSGASSHPTGLGDSSFGCSVGALSRFLFVVGHVALKHLVYVESCARDVRRMRVNRDKEAAQAAADRRDAELAGVVTEETQESAEETVSVHSLLFRTMAERISDKKKPILPDSAVAFAPRWRESEFTTCGLQKASPIQKHRADVCD